MFIKAFPSGPLHTNAYIVACSQTRQAIIIDPAPHSFDSLQQTLEQGNLTLQSILLTHSHWDHIADVKRVKDTYHVPVFVHALDAPNLEHPGADQLPFSIPIDGVVPDKYLKENDVIYVGDLSFIVIETPGHSAGCICFYSKEQESLISGDTLFKGSMGSISFPTSRPDLMWSSLNKLADLPPSTKVFPGHGSQTTIGRESWLRDAEKIFGN